MSDAASLEAAILELCRRRGTGRSICPSEAARAVDGDDWRALMPGIREAGRRLAAAGRIEVTQGGTQVDPGSARGPVRFRLPPS